MPPIIARSPGGGGIGPPPNTWFLAPTRHPKQHFSRFRCFCKTVVTNRHTQRPLYIGNNRPHSHTVHATTLSQAVISNLRRPHHRHARIIQSYSPGGVYVHPIQYISGFQTFLTTDPYSPQAQLADPHTLGLPPLHFRNPGRWSALSLPPPIAARGSGGALKLPQQVRPGSGCQTHSDSF